MSDYAVPLLIVCVLLYGLLRRVACYDTFLDGAKRGLQSAIDIIPCLVAMLTFVTVLARSGALGVITGFLAPVFDRIGVPEGALGVFIVRPFSGSAALAMLESVFKTYGTDSVEGRVASVMVGSSETIFYTLPLYLAAAKVRKSRYAVPCALAAWLAGGVSSAWAVRLLGG